MALVRLNDALSALAGGVEEIEVDARTVGALVQALEMGYPRLGAEIASGMEVAIDGEIIEDPESEPLEYDSEVSFLPRGDAG